MDLLQCVSPTFPDNRTRKSATYATVDKPVRRSPVRQVQSEERDVQRKGNSLPVQRRISLPAGHYAASPGKIFVKLFLAFSFIRTQLEKLCNF